MTPGHLFDMGTVGPAPAIPKGHGRYLFRCSGNLVASYAYNGVVSVPCAPVWLTLEEERRRSPYGYDSWQTFIRPINPPVRCSCGAYIGQVHRLEVSESAQREPTHTCENTCQWSESKKCRCACGGTAHGRMLREWDR